MPIRGERSVWPTSGKSPTGIFSTRGRQKMDDTGRFAHQSDLSYAKGSGTRSKPSSNGKQSLRHVKHFGKKR